MQNSSNEQQGLLVQSQGEVERLNHAIQSLQGELEQAHDELSSAQGQLHASETDRSTLETRVDELETELETRGDRLRELSEQLESASQRCRQLESHVQNSSNEQQGLLVQSQGEVERVNQILQAKLKEMEGMRREMEAARSQFQQMHARLEATEGERAALEDRLERVRDELKDVLRVPTRDYFRLQRAILPLEETSSIKPINELIDAVVEAQANSGFGSPRHSRESSKSDVPSGLVTPTKSQPSRRLSNDLSPFRAGKISDLVGAPISDRAQSQVPVTPSREFSKMRLSYQRLVCYSLLCALS